MDTPASLLERLRQPAEQHAWARFVDLYTPLLYYWARRTGCPEPDAADLVQEVFLVLIRRLPAFTYDHHKSFRGWLRAITLNKWRDRRRRAGLPLEPGDPTLAELPGPDGVDSFGEAEYRHYLVGRALELMRAEFQRTTWQACWESVVSGRPAAEVAAELGMSVDAVYAAKSRVLRRLRQELDGLWE
jgi:RNA polymerase sigma-70 factor (ECF subfamily)